jgi:hypothetical protein
MTSYDDFDSQAPSNLELDVRPVAPPPAVSPALPPARIEFVPLARPAPRPSREVDAHPAGLARSQVFLALAALVTVALGLWLWLRPVRVTDLIVKGPEGQTLHLVDLYQQHDRLLVVCVVAGADSLGKFAIDQAKTEYAARSESLGFAGMYVGSQADADRYRAEHAVPFPMYGLNDTLNPILANAFAAEVGGHGRLIYGGTSVLLDEKQRVLFHLEGADVQKLHERLAAAAE